VTSTRLGITWSSHYPYKNDNVSGVVVRDPDRLRLFPKAESDLTSTASAERDDMIVVANLCW
jgi:hypothetical protein